MDRGEDIALMEPMRIREDSPHRVELTELAFELAAKSSGFTKSIPVGVEAPLATLVRSMNCYYSNLIEGHHTHPVDIERAMNQDYANEPEKRDLQLEARAHVTVQQWIDDGGLATVALGSEAIREMHRRFGELLPDSLLWMEDPESDGQMHMEPGKLRTRDVKVGRHVAISPDAPSALPVPIRKGLWRSWQGRNDFIGRCGPPPAGLDSSFSRRQWQSRSLDVPCITA